MNPVSGPPWESIAPANIAYVVPPGRQPGYAFTWETEEELTALLIATIHCHVLDRTPDLATPHGPVVIWNDGDGVTDPPNGAAMSISEESGHIAAIAGTVVITGAPATNDDMATTLNSRHVTSLDEALHEWANTPLIEDICERIKAALRTDDFVAADHALAELYAISPERAALIALALMFTRRNR
jgi:hypothetical protein